MIVCLIPKYFPKMCMETCEEKLFKLIRLKGGFVNNSSLARDLVLKNTYNYEKLSSG